MRAVCWEVTVLSFGALAALVTAPAFVPATAVAQTSAIQAAALARPSEYASQQRSRAAVGHYSRARTMCIESIEEFEAGRKYARPDLLVDAEEWRLSMISLCEQLNRLIDPKVKIDRGGIYVGANPRLIRRAKDQLPPVADGPKDRNDYGDKQYMQRQQEARASMKNPQAPAIGQERSVAQPAKKAPAQPKAQMPKEPVKAIQPPAPSAEDAIEDEPESPAPDSASNEPAVDEHQSASSALEVKKSLEALRANAPQDGTAAAAKVIAKPPIAQEAIPEDDAPAPEAPQGSMRKTPAEEVQPMIHDEAPVDDQGDDTAHRDDEAAPEEPQGGEKQAMQPQGGEPAAQEEIVVEKQPAPAAAQGQKAAVKGGSEDDQIAQAIEDAITKRLQALKEPGDGSAAAPTEGADTAAEEDSPGAAE